MGRGTMCCFLLLILSECVWDNSTKPEVEVHVREGDDAILPCFFSPVQDNAGVVFDWKKDEMKEVFLFSDGPVYNKGHSGQDQQFSGRVTHFPDGLKSGNASIKIRSATVADSGNYTCVFPRNNMQTHFIRLLVGIPARPNLTVINATEGRVRLRCEVEAAHHEPEVALVNTSGHVLSSEEPQVSEENGRYKVTILTTVSETGLVRCHVKQKEIHHEAFTDVFVYIHWQTKKSDTDTTYLTMILPLFLTVIFAIRYLAKKWKIRKLPKKGLIKGEKESVEEILIDPTADGPSYPEECVKNSAAEFAAASSGCTPPSYHMT